MSAAPPLSVPAWQTEELQDEWIEPDDHDSDNDNNLTYGTRSISLTAPLTTHIQTSAEHSNISSSNSLSTAPVGTFLVRENVPNAPLHPKTPGFYRKHIVKDFFSPMALERMFEPPSPPDIQPSTMPSSIQQPSIPPQIGHEVDEDEIVETDMPSMASFHGRKPSIDCQFTFAVPREGFLHPNKTDDGAFPQAQSTPNPPTIPTTAAPTTDPRLRLFQFQYDTYTREHLSAMVDSIAINSNSGATPSPTYSSHILSRVSEAIDSVVDMSHLRSTKRVKLSPRSEFFGEGVGEGASIARPKVFKDYVGESRSLMQQIKQARDFSTISTVANGGEDSPSSHDNDVASNGQHSHERRSSLLVVPTVENTKSTSNGSYSSSYREQAATLMAQIKQDMKGHKRLFSEDTVSSHLTAHVEDKFDSSGFKAPNIVSVYVSSYDKGVQGPRRISSVKTNSLRHKPSLRESSRRALEPVTKESDQPLVNELSKMSIQSRRFSSQVSLQSNAVSSPPSGPPSSLPTSVAVPSGLAPPFYSSSSLRADDLNRFVSSSTASGTTLTAGSVPSFTKHAGPAHIRTIAPTDLPDLPDKLGDMFFDKEMMKWVKNTARATQVGGGSDEPLPLDEASEDPFGDIESLRDDSKNPRGESEPVEGPDVVPPLEMSLIDEQSEADDEEVDMTSFLTDDPSALIVDVMTGVETIDDDDQTTDSDDDQDEQGPTITGAIVDYDSDEAVYQPTVKSSSPVRIAAEPPEPIPLEPTTPDRVRSSLTTTPIIRSALKSHSATPASVLKDPSRSKGRALRNKKAHRRSVSFSDGKRDGPIQGLGESTDGDDNIENILTMANIGSANTSGIVLSARSRRIAQMMYSLEDTESDDSPSKITGSSRPEIHVLSSQKVVASHPPRGIFSRSDTYRIPFTEDGQSGNATFLTECSFGVSHDRLVEVITDVQPFVPHWEELSSIDLSGKKLESVARLKEFLPRLEVLNLNSNQLAWLSGIPGTVRTLSVASNRLTKLASYSQLINLENLDISHNDIESLSQLTYLRHLRDLKADGNKITNIDGLQGMESLVKLNLQGNSIRSVDLKRCRWSRLEMLNLSLNRLENIHGLSSLEALVILNIDNNEVGGLEVDRTMPKLRVLRVSGNRLEEFHVGSMPNLRTLYADNNSLSKLVKLERLMKLENLSLRNQSGRGLNLLTRDVRDVKRLYLSGNPLKAEFLSEPCYNLIYLEVAACRLTALPEDLSRLVPNLRVLNLNYNFLEDARALDGLTRLKRLTMIGSRLKGTKALIRLLERMPDVEMLDFRMNPFTLGWYLPLLVRDIPGALQPSEGRGGWQELDSKFRRDLPNESYIGRLAYRGLIMRACPRIRIVDGVEVTEKERAKAHGLLVGMRYKLGVPG